MPTRTCKGVPYSVVAFTYPVVSQLTWSSSSKLNQSQRTTPIMIGAHAFKKEIATHLRIAMKLKACSPTRWSLAPTCFATLVASFTTRRHIDLIGAVITRWTVHKKVDMSIAQMISLTKDTSEQRCDMVKLLPVSNKVHRTAVPATQLRYAYGIGPT